MDEHHLVPKTFKGKEKEALHRVCHTKIHSVFTERELANYYHTWERLRNHTEIGKFVAWIAKKPIDFYDRNAKTKVRKGKRRR